MASAFFNNFVSFRCDIFLGKFRKKIFKKLRFQCACKSIDFLLSINVVSFNASLYALCIFDGRFFIKRSLVSRTELAINLFN